MSATWARTIMACWPGEGDHGGGGVVDLVAKEAGRRSRTVAGSHGALSLTDLVTNSGGVLGYEGRSRRPIAKAGRRGRSQRKNVAKTHDGECVAEKEGDCESIRHGVSRW